MHVFELREETRELKKKLKNTREENANSKHKDYQLPPDLLFMA